MAFKHFKGDHYLVIDVADDLRKSNIIMENEYKWFAY